MTKGTPIAALNGALATPLLTSRPNEHGLGLGDIPTPIHIEVRLWGGA